MFMKRIIYIALVPALFAAPAQSDPKDWEDLRKGLEGLSQNTLEFFESWVEDLGPILNSLGDRVGNLQNYEKPEVLPNGDIIFRRKPKPKIPTEQKPSIDL
jgi:hypothetical protein